MDKESLLKLAQNKDEKLVISKIIDTVLSAEKTNYVKCSKFLNGREQHLAQIVFNSHKSIYKFYGGYNDFERAIAICYSDEIYVDTYIPPVKIVEIRLKDGDKLNHRDYLGALMGLGIKREMIGDIIADQNGAKLFVLEEIAEYLKAQITKIGKYNVSVYVYNVGEIIVPEKQFKEISFTVSSLRIDGIIAGSTGVSRSEAASLVNSGRVTLNWENVVSVSKQVSENQIISIKGHGRFKIKSVGGTTKKGRIFITVQKFI